MTAEYISTTTIGYNELILSMYVRVSSIKYYIYVRLKYLSMLIIKLNKEIINLYYYIHIRLWVLE